MTNVPKTIEEDIETFIYKAFSSGMEFQAKLQLTNEDAKKTKDELCRELTQAITTWALECVGEDELHTHGKHTDELGCDTCDENELKAEIRQRITQSMGEGV